jgi:hypothetical protein
MLSLFSALVECACDQNFLIADYPQTFSIAVPPGQVVCVNSSSVGGLFIGVQFNFAFFSYYNATDYSQYVARSTSAFLSVEITSSQDDFVTFTTVAFPNQCTIGLYYSSRPNDSFLLTNASTVPIQNYDDRCVLIHGYSDTNTTLVFDTELNHDYLLINGNNSLRFSGSGTYFVTGKPLSIWFSSDFSTLSNYIKVTTKSDATNRNAVSGSFPGYHPTAAPKPHPDNAGEKDPLSRLAIILICLASVLVVGSALAITVYCLVFAEKKKTGPEPATDIARVHEVRAQSLICDELDRPIQMSFIDVPDATTDIV